MKTLIGMVVTLSLLSGCGTLGLRPVSGPGSISEGLSGSNEPSNEPSNRPSNGLSRGLSAFGAGMQQRRSAVTCYSDDYSGYTRCSRD